VSIGHFAKPDTHHALSLAAQGGSSVAAITVPQRYWPSRTRRRLDCAGAVAPLIAGRMSTDLRAVHTGPGYECRNRNAAAFGKLSADAVAQAIDISAFELSSGKVIPIKPDGDETMRNV
jgi:hypothetical protein